MVTKIWDWAKCYNRHRSKNNVWVAKKDTKRSSVLLLCLVTFFATQTLYEWPDCSSAKMVYSLGDHFGKRTAWSLLYFFNYAYMIFSPVANFGDHPLGSYNRLPKEVQIAYIWMFLMLRCNAIEEETLRLLTAACSLKRQIHFHVVFECLLKEQTVCRITKKYRGINRPVNLRPDI